MPFTARLIDAVLPEPGLQADGVLYVFPTEASKRAAIRAFQSRWDFYMVTFWTMEELKQQLFAGSKPLLVEEKRTLAFYNALTAEDKQHFRINNYFQSIELAHNFFTLWEEMSEEMVRTDGLMARLEDDGDELLDWQRAMWTRFGAIREQYRRFINEKGYDDLLFRMRPDGLSLVPVERFVSVHFVNQFYYTNLEKYILDQFDAAGKNVTLHYQLPAHLVDEHSLDIRPFSVLDLGQPGLKKLTILECRSEFAMFNAMVRAVQDGGGRHVVNFSELSTAQARLLSPQQFNVGGSGSLAQSAIFVFFKDMLTLLESIIHEPGRNLLLVPLTSLLAIVRDTNAPSLFARETGVDATEMADFIYGLLDRDYRYTDIDGHFIAAARKHKAQPACLALLQFIKRLLRIRNLSDFIDLIDAPDGIVINDLLSETDRRYTDMRERFYRALADFASLADSSLVENWDALFENRRLPVQLWTPAGILHLFLDYLKPKHFRYDMQRQAAPRVDFTSLQDTRNLSFSKVMIYNAVEGEIPHARRTPFLFTERQRKSLGLKTYDDVRLREKYYLHRLVLTTPEVLIFTQKNIEENIDISSFVEDLKLHLPQEKVTIVEHGAEHYTALYDQAFKQRVVYHVNEERNAQEQFYSVPFNRDEDFGTALDLTFYALKDLLENRFAFFIKRLVGLREKVKRVGSDFDAKLIGNVVHESLNLFWREVLPTLGAPPYAFRPDEIEPSTIDEAMARALDKFYYSRPHNYADVYFEQIMQQRIKDGVLDFLSFLDQHCLKRKLVFIYPEKDEPSVRPEYIDYFSSDKIDFTVRIGGRADLRIETADRTGYFIFDYKTGEGDKKQLLLYELYYYLLEGRTFPDAVSSYFVKIFDQDYPSLKKANKSKDDLIADLESNVKNAIKTVWIKGFDLPDTKTRASDMQDISRSDLYFSKFRPQRLERGALNGPVR